MPSSIDASQAYSPASASVVSVPTRFFDANRHAFTLGGGIELRSPLPSLTLDLFAQLHLLQPRTMTLHPGPSGDPSSEARVSGSVLVGGVVLGVKF